MGILSKLFKKVITKDIEGLGTFTYNNDGDSEYWAIEEPVANLEQGFDFGAIEGTTSEVFSEAQDCFIKYAEHPEKLIPLMSSECFEKISEHFPGTSAENIKTEFFLKSLTTTNKHNFEFGFQSKSKEIFAEVFIRDGKFKEICIDV